MSFIKNFINIFKTTESNLLLGRWKINYCQNILNRKIDFANSDHSGHKVLNHDIDQSEYNLVKMKKSSEKYIQ